MIFILFYFFFLEVNIPRNFFIIVLLCILFYMHIQRKNKEIKDNTTMNSFIDSLEKDITRNIVSFKNIYTIHKAPKRIQYLRIHIPFKKFLYDLRYLKKYDKHNFLTIVILCEFFLKYHYNIIIGKYDVQTYNQIILDVRQEMLNTLYSSIYNIPSISTIVDKKDLDKYLYIMCVRLQSITQKYIDIIHNSKRNFKINKHPIAYDINKDNNYDIL